MWSSVQIFHAIENALPDHAHVGNIYNMTIYRIINVLAGALVLVSN